MILTGLFILGGLSIGQKSIAQEKKRSTLETEFERFLSSVTPNNRQISYEEYLKDKENICLTDITDKSVSMSYRREDGSQFSIRYSLRDKNKDGKIDRIFVDFEDIDGRKDVTIVYDDYAFSKRLYNKWNGTLPEGYARYGRLYDFHGTCMGMVTHAVLDSNKSEQGCFCKECPPKPLKRIEAFVVASDSLVQKQDLYEQMIARYQKSYTNHKKRKFLWW